MTNDLIWLMRMDADRIYRRIPACIYEDHFTVSRAARCGLWTVADLVPINRYVIRQEAA